MKDYLLDAACTLRRNYADLPFDTMTNAETARRVNERAMVALERSGESYAYLAMDGLPADRREELEEYRLISPDTREAVSGAAYLRMDERACVETSGEDHVVIGAYNENGDLLQCYGDCAGIAALLEDTGRMARSARFGFLTAKPCDAGTGMRASLRLHLPMTVMGKQLPAAMKLAIAEGANLRLVGNGICVLENRAAMSADSEMILKKVEECARKLCALERALRWRAKERKDINVADKAWRAYALAQYALRMGRNEALRLWSDMTLGASSDDMPYAQAALDRLWHIAHMPEGKLLQDTNLQPDVERARRVRAIFSGGN
ncbi:MAG: hypothetical protein IJ214_01420 [Clostridia bacterium]|nr:hypothetical protein [Clostridia bacterium]